MANDDIDLDRVVSDPGYRRQVIEQLNAEAPSGAGDGDPTGNLIDDLGFTVGR